MLNSIQFCVILEKVFGCIWNPQKGVHCTLDTLVPADASAPQRYDGGRTAAMAHALLLSLIETEAIQPMEPTYGFQQHTNVMKQPGVDPFVLWKMATRRYKYLCVPAPPTGWFIDPPGDIVSI